MVSTIPKQEHVVSSSAPYNSQQNNLNVPSHIGRRRSSLESVFSELSELSIMSNEPSTQALVRRKLSNASNISELSTSSMYSSRTRPSLRQRLNDFYDQNYGAFLVLLSQFFGSLMNIFTRLLEHPGPHGEPMHPFQILFTRQSLTAVLCTAYALTTKSIPHFPLGPPDRNVRFLLACRGLTGFFGVFGMYFSLLYLPLSEATVLTFLAPILTCYLCSHIIPGESFSRQQQLAGFVSLLGVVFIAQPASFLFQSDAPLPSTTTVISAPIPISNTTMFNNTALLETDGGEEPVSMRPTPSQHLLAIAIAMVGVLGATGAMTSIRAIGTRAHAFISINYFSVWSSFVCLVALIVIPDVSFRLPGNLIEWALLISLGCCGFVMQGLLTMGLAYKATGRGGGSGQPRVESAKNDMSTDDIPAPHASGSEDIELQIQAKTDHAVTVLGTQSSGQAAGGSSHTRRHRPTRMKSRGASSSGTKATSMVYMQMLFALGADRVVFGTVPGVWSWIGSGLILAGAIWVASARDGSPEVKGSENTAQVLHDSLGMQNLGDDHREEQASLLRAGEMDRQFSDEEDSSSNGRSQSTPQPGT